MLKYVDFAVDRCWAVTDGMEVSVKLDLVVMVL